MNKGGHVGLVHGYPIQQLSSIAGYLYMQFKIPLLASDDRVSCMYKPDTESDRQNWPDIRPNRIGSVYLVGC